MPPLTSDELIIFKNMLIEHEALKLFPYLDCCGKAWKKCQCDKQGKLTIGVGRNLDDVGITEDEAMYFLYNNITQVTIEVERKFGSWFKRLNSPRKIVVLSMVFNIGLMGFKTFEKMIKSIESGDFNSAANQMLMSKWASQVGGRAVELSHIMRTGSFNQGRE